MAQKLKILSVLWLIVACLATTPTKPTEATTPTKPTEATTPTKPTEATKPTKPTEATKPTKPTEATTPTKPTEATTPTKPTEATTPTKPTEATTPTKPTEATTPTKPTEATKPTKPTEATTPTKPTEATTPTKPTEATTPTKPTEATTPTKPTEATTPTKPTEATTPTKPTEATTPTKPTEATTPTTTTAGPAATTTPTATTTKLPDPCDGNPCGDGSTCVPRYNQTFACLCLVGENYNYDSRRCESAKVFPGQLILIELTYKETMSDNTSPEFQSTSKEITEALLNVFEDLMGYSESTVLALQPNKASKVWSRSETGVSADVEIIFTEQAEITTVQVTEKIKTASSGDGVLKHAEFKDTNLCVKKPCDESSTTCKWADGSFNCTCSDNYIKTDYTTKMCIACPSGQKTEGSEKCVNCPFGYSGFNCNESWKLVLVIVGSVLGGLLLITLILLPVVARKSSKKSSKMNKNADIGKPYISHPPANKPLVNSSLANSRATSVNRQDNGLSPFANAGDTQDPTGHKHQQLGQQDQPGDDFEHQPAKHDP
ncbi:uncharacterized protein LOC144536550 isoform X2 [Sander vitreus]